MTDLPRILRFRPTSPTKPWRLFLEDGTELPHAWNVEDLPHEARVIVHFAAVFEDVDIPPTKDTQHG